MTKTADPRIPPCLIFIDREGRWYHEGVEMIRRDIIQLFYQNMVLDPEGRYIIHWNGQVCFVEVEDTAFVVLRVDCERLVPGKGQFVLWLSDDSQETLVPETLSTGQNNVLYCRVKNRTFPARFSRAAYYQLAEWIEEEEGVFFLTAGGQKYVLLE